MSLIADFCNICRTFCREQGLSDSELLEAEPADWNPKLREINNIKEIRMFEIRSRKTQDALHQPDLRRKI